MDVESFLDQKFLKQLEKLKIVTKKGVKGPERGEHKSWRSGEGLEFLDYRKYQLGDDLRYVDWSVYGRLDKLFIKLFHAEESQTVHLLLDVSKSMGVSTQAKETSAKKIAAAVSYICLSNFDKISLIAFADKLLEIRPLTRGKRRYPQVLNFLMSLTPDAETDINTCLTEYANLCKNPGIALVMSDLFDPKGYQEGLKALTYRDFDIHLLHILDHEELAWSRTGTLILQDIETGAKKTTFLDSALVQLYRQKMTGFLTETRDFCHNYGIHYYVYDTSIVFEDFLIDYLTKGAILR
ncbi:MAG: DUF58 domain-containing protein [Candidatus Vecturithrix sp.]|jgi:uncharacterized protein (DUF58 family)|nr:DUF58 domain-containing protein [Candidatus Vecturithrix sp.]